MWTLFPLVVVHPRTIDPLRERAQGAYRLGKYKMLFSVPCQGWYTCTKKVLAQASWVAAAVGGCSRRLPPPQSLFLIFSVRVADFLSHQQQLNFFVLMKLHMRLSASASLERVLTPFLCRRVEKKNVSFKTKIRHWAAKFRRTSEKNKMRIRCVHAREEISKEGLAAPHEEQRTNGEKRGAHAAHANTYLLIYCCWRYETSSHLMLALPSPTARLKELPSSVARLLFLSPVQDRLTDLANVCGGTCGRDGWCDDGDDDGEETLSDHLYDIEADPRETNDLIDELPDVRFEPPTPRAVL